MRAALALLLLLAAPAHAQDDGPEAMPAGPHRDETFYFCTSCHGAQLIIRQGMSRERWDETLHWMTEKQAMPALEGEDRRLILDYLAMAFPPKAPAGWQNPFAPQ